MGTLQAGLRPSTRQNEFAREQADAGVGNQAAIDSYCSQETLDRLFDAYSGDLANQYCTLALLDAHPDRLIGQQISCSRTQAALQQLAQNGLILDGLFGFRSERRSSSSRSRPDLVPHDAISFPSQATENVAVRVFVARIPHVTRSLRDLCSATTRPHRAAAVQQSLQINAIAVLPLLVQSDCLGVIAIASSASKTLVEQALPKLTRLAAEIALTVANARLRQEMRQLEHQVSVLLKATIDAQEEERERICLEIHDGVAQTLAPAFQYLQTLDRAPELPENLRAKVRKAETLVREAIREAREVIGTLRPAALDTLGLAATLHFEVDELAAQCGWQVDFDADQVRFPKAVETALYRIVHEAITNVSKHGAAKQIVVRVKHKDGYVFASVQDDGIGFAPSVVEHNRQRKGVGLLSMRKRTELLDGIFRLISDPGQGTLVSVEVPISRITDIVSDS